MRINIKVTNIEMTNSISDYLNKRIESFDKFIDLENESPICYVEIAKTTNHHKSGDIFKAEMTIHLGGQVFRAEFESADLYSSIDTVKDEILSELRKFKNKKANLMKRGGRIFKDMIRGIYGKIKRKK